jgi:hypothetical protein
MLPIGGWREMMQFWHILACIKSVLGVAVLFSNFASKRYGDEDMHINCHRHRALLIVKPFCLDVAAGGGGCIDTLLDIWYNTIVRRSDD